jgi:hypothetical protein
MQKVLFIYIELFLEIGFVMKRSFSPLKVRFVEATKTDGSNIIVMFVTDCILETLPSMCVHHVMLQGTTTYFSSNCTLDDANLVAQLLKHRNMEACNSRVFKTVENGIPTYEVNLLLACSAVGSDSSPLWKFYHNSSGLLL